LLHHGRFVDVEGEAKSVIVGDLHQLFDLLDVGAAMFVLKKTV